MFQHFKDFMAKPFSADMSATNWFLFLGLVVVIVVLWRIVLAHILYGVGELTQ